MVKRKELYEKGKVKGESWAYYERVIGRRGREEDEG